MPDTSEKVPRLEVCLPLPRLDEELAVSMVFGQCRCLLLYLIVPSDDLLLLEAWKGGDTAAADALVRRHFESLCRFFRNKVDDGVDDLIQDTLLTCLARSKDIPEKWSFRTYLFVVARDRLVDRYRGLAQPVDFDASLSSVAQCSGSPSAVAAQRSEQRLVLAALRHIPLDLQIALELHYWEGLPGSEIARVLGIPEGTVRSRIRRAHEQLRLRLSELAASREELEHTMSALGQWAESLRGHASEAVQRAKQ